MGILSRQMRLNVQLRQEWSFLSWLDHMLMLIVLCVRLLETGRGPRGSVLLEHVRKSIFKQHILLESGNTGF